MYALYADCGTVNMHVVVGAPSLFASGGVVPKHVMEVKEEQRKKAISPMLVTLLPMVTEVRVSQEEKA